MTDHYNPEEWESGEDRSRFRNQERPQRSGQERSRETGPAGRYGQGESFSRYGVQGWEREQQPGQFSRPTEWSQRQGEERPWERSREPSRYGNAQLLYDRNDRGSYGMEYPESAYRSPGGYGEMFSGDMRQYTGQSQSGYYNSGREGTGKYTGRGPKGYQRSDERIKEDVCECLTRHPEVDAEDIDVQVKDGEVTLTGTVMDRYQKRAAEDALERVSGVRDVHNQLRAGIGEGRSSATQGTGPSGTPTPSPDPFRTSPTS